ncbi:MAG TPA: hypothetical protein VGS02_17785 [Acidobacteriaceae bacterium]|nr:hypothetical protein [Acidobacteriaceae bacterium]
MRKSSRICPNNPDQYGVNYGESRVGRVNCSSIRAIVVDMWRISALLWSIVEWCEERAARRRLLYCLTQHPVTNSSASERARAAFNHKLRAMVAFVFLVLAGRR